MTQPQSIPIIQVSIIQMSRRYKAVEIKRKHEGQETKCFILLSRTMQSSGADDWSIMPLFKRAVLPSGEVQYSNSAYVSAQDPGALNSEVEVQGYDVTSGK